MLNYYMAYITWNVDPDLFVIPYINHPVRWYGLFWVLGLAASYNILSRVLKKDGKSPEFLEQLALYIIVGTVIGARLGHVLFYDPDYYLSNPLKVFAIYEGGLASHGGGIGILLAMFLFARKNHIGYLWLADRLALVVPLAGAFIRLGNLMNSEMIGIPTTVPWAFIFSRIDQTPRHPAQLYEAIFCILIFGILYLLWKKTTVSSSAGDVFAILLISVFSFRFLDEFFKISQESFEDGMLLNMGQLLSIPFIVTGVLILLYNYNQRRKQSAG